MSSFVEAPLDDRYSTRTTGPNWVDLHKNVFESIIREAFRLILEESKEPIEPDLAEQIKRFTEYQRRENELMKRAEIFNLRESVEYALGRISWDIFISGN